MKPWEVDALEKPLLRRIVLVEANARPFLRMIEGLWGNGTKGTRGAIPKPATMTEYIRERGLLSAEEVDRLIGLAPRVRAERKMLRESLPPEWRALIAALPHETLHLDETPDLYAHVTLDGRDDLPTQAIEFGTRPEQLPLAR